MICPYCQGKGMVEVSLVNNMFTRLPCEQCQGTGSMISQDKQGQDVTMGDQVSLRLKVCGLRPKANLTTGKVVGSQLELAYDLDGYDLHLLVCDANMVTKETK